MELTETVRAKKRQKKLNIGVEVEVKSKVVDTISIKENIKSWFGGEDNPGWCPDTKYIEGIDKKTGVLKFCKSIPCGKASCDVCGKPGSLAHRRRIARGYSKILGASTLGYFVFTFPEKVRSGLKDKKTLGDFEDFIRDLLSKYPFVLGVVRCWHWGGDEHKGVFNPHLNVLVNIKGGMISKAVLKYLRAKVKWWLFDRFLYRGPVFIHYNYCVNNSMRIHKWKYFTRPTLLLCGPDQVKVLTVLLHNFRNVRWSGHWDKCPDEYLDRGHKVLFDESIRWEYVGSFKLLSSKILNDPGWDYLGCGVFQRTRASPENDLSLLDFGRSDLSFVARCTRAGSLPDKP